MKTRHKPAWLKVSLPGGANYNRVKALVRGQGLHTVCESARCPNIGECWELGSAAIMILGDICTRRCEFCSVATGQPNPVDDNEHFRVAKTVQLMELDNIVITSVTRDDLDDGGASIWNKTIKTVRHINPDTDIEVLIPDFNGNTELLEIVLDAKPDVLAHNLETVERLQKKIRKRANYQDSMKILTHSKSEGFRTKTGLMLGLGETTGEMEKTIIDVAEAGVDILTIGQYLQPTRNNHPVVRWVTPGEFKIWKQTALGHGIKSVSSSPLVRSSYRVFEKFI